MLVSLNRLPVPIALPIPIVITQHTTTYPRLGFIVERINNNAIKPPNVSDPSPANKQDTIASGSTPIKRGNGGRSWARASVPRHTTKTTKCNFRTRLRSAIKKQLFKNSTNLRGIVWKSQECERVVSVVAIIERKHKAIMGKCNHMGYNYLEIRVKGSGCHDCWDDKMIIMRRMDV